MSLWIDVTTAASCPPPATGIPRVELKLAEQTVALDPDVRFCLHEAQLGRYSEVKVGEFRRIADLHRSSRAAPGSIELEVHRQHPLFARGDVLVTCGFNWRPQFANMPALYALRGAIGLRVIAMCHDLVPLKFTHFVPGMEIGYAPYLTDMVRHADHILCNSRCTRRDLLDWSGASGESPPATSVLPLGSDGPSVGDGVPGERVARILARPYLLSVGTLESRKNHEVLCRAYTRLLEWGVSDLPLLVFVGQLGQGGQALVDEITADHRLRGRVAILSGVSDGELAALYAGCLFTLYPSLYEGWGLPVSEALAHGKFCLASDQGSLPEAGGTFADYADPWNVEAWANKIHRYLRIPSALKRREIEIRDHHRPVRWADSATHLLSVAAALGRTS